MNQPVNTIDTAAGKTEQQKNSHQIMNSSINRIPIEPILRRLSSTTNPTHTLIRDLQIRYPIPILVKRLPDMYEIP